LQEVWVFRVWL